MNYNGSVGVFYTLEDSNFFDFLLRNYAFVKYNNVDELLESVHQTKIVFVQMSYPYSTKAETILNQYRDAQLEFCIAATELHNHDHAFYCLNDRANINYYINGGFNFALAYSKVYSFMDWFRETKDHYLTHSFDSNYTFKKNKFDALLGRNKPHRKLINDALASNPAIYLKFNHSRFDIDLATWDSGVDNLSIHGDLKHTVETVNYNNKNIRLSQIIPTNIYNQSYYSIVAETHTDNSLVFLTEKTAKPLIAKRLFVLFGSRYSLQFLHSIGFKTFDSVIDESYDSIEATDTRMMQALAQVEYLCKQDPQIIIEKIKPVVEHNHRLIMDTDWQAELKGYFARKFN